MMFSRAAARPFQIVVRTLQWASAVIVMGLSSFFISRPSHNGTHIVYEDIIAILSVVFFLPAFLSPFWPRSLSRLVLAIDVIFSYLWLTAFIFAAQDYDHRLCFLIAPPGVSCSRKRANEAFIFLAFIFTFFGIFLEAAAFWAWHKETHPATGAHLEKNGGGRVPLDAPVAPAAPAPAAAPAGTV